MFVLAAPAAAAPRVWYPTLEDVGGPTRAVVSRAARRAITGAILWDDGDKLETGGPLFGRVGAGGNFVVSDAHAAALERTPSRCSIDLDVPPPLGIELVGCFHVHTDERVPKPSHTDIVGWRAALKSSAFTHWLGVIAVRGERSWGRPALYAWLVSEDGEPAAVHVTYPTI